MAWFPPSGEHRKVLFVSLPRLPASHKRCKVAWFGDAGGSETIETIPNIILQVHSATVTWNCWKYFGNLKRVTNTRDYQPTIHSGTQMWTCAPRRNFRGKDSISRQQIRLPRTQSMLKQLITMDC